jgi:hypothetical protein
MAFDDDNEDYGEPDRHRLRAEDWPHSGVGIASFIGGIVSLLMFIAAIGVATAAVAGSPRGREPSPTVVMTSGLLIVGAGLIALIGAGLGIGACCQTERKKVFGVIGLVINSVVVLGGTGLVLVGLLAQNVPQ